MKTDVIETNNNELMTVQDASMLILDPAAMKSMMDLATFMSSGTLTLPEAYRKNPANCLAVVMQAVQWRMNPFSVAQKTHFVSGNIGYEAQLVAAVINGSGATKGAFNFDWYGDWSKVIGKFEVKKGDKGEYRIPGWALKDEDGLGVKVWATLRGESEPRVLDLLLAQARTRNSTLWADDPRQQLAYLAQKRWARLYTPGVILGVYTPDEVEQMEPKEINPQPSGSTTTNTGTVIDQAQEERRNGLITALEAFASKGTNVFLAEWRKVGKSNKQDAYLVGQQEYDRLFNKAQLADEEAKTTAEHKQQNTEENPQVDDQFVADMNAAEAQ